MADLEKLANILGADTVKKIYEEGLSEPTKESSKLLIDLIKAARLFTAPIQLLASYQDRLGKYFEKVRNAVPEENQIEAPASFSGPIIERLRYLEDDNYLTDLYLNLLKRAIDKERINEAHPAFFHIIDQLSPDEAMLLFLLKEKEMHYDYTRELLKDNDQKDIWGETIIKSELPQEKFIFFNNFTMYVEHLRSLNLLSWNVFEEKAIKVDEIQTHTYVKTNINLSEFGLLFVKACISEDGFNTK